MTREPTAAAIRKHGYVKAKIRANGRSAQPNRSVRNNGKGKKGKMNLYLISLDATDDLALRVSGRPRYPQLRIYGTGKHNWLVKATSKAEAKKKLARHSPHWFGPATDPEARSLGITIRVFKLPNVERDDITDLGANGIKLA